MLATWILIAWLPLGADDDQPKTYETAHFKVMTDVPPDEAKGIMADLEKMYDQLVIYFGAGVIRKIPGYVIKDIRKYPKIPPDARERIEAGGGLTVGRSRGQMVGGKYVPQDAESAFWSAAKNRDVVLHEAVHAFCNLAFGRTGPTWFAEGFAEIGQYWRGSSEEVNAHEVVIEYLQSGDPRIITKTADESDMDSGTWKDYAWRWSLCHFLAHHPTYTKRFRALGLDYLNDRESTFGSVFSKDLEPMWFEYRLFIKYMEPGYRVDLCTWDWTPNKKLPPGVAKKTSIHANRGWQSAKAHVEPEIEYELTIDGSWKLEKDGENVDADAESGTGNIVAIILKDDKELTEEFALGGVRQWKPPVAGQLYLRCNESWGKLKDNKGQVKFNIRRPKQGAAAKDAPGKAAPTDKTSKKSKSSEDEST